MFYHNLSFLAAQNPIMPSELLLKSMDVGLVACGHDLFPHLCYISQIFHLF